MKNYFNIFEHYETPEIAGFSFSEMLVLIEKSGKINKMETLKFSIIKSKEQYDRYCNILEDLVVLEDHSIQDEIELLTLLIEKWDDEHNSFNDLNPIELLKAIMAEHNLKAIDLVDILGLSKGTVSKMLNCQKGLSKDTIRKLSDYFKVSQEAFNRPYRLINEVKNHSARIIIGLAHR